MTLTLLADLLESSLILAVLYGTRGRIDAIAIVGLVIVYLVVSWYLQGLKRTLAEFVIRVDQHFIDVKGQLGWVRNPGDVQRFEDLKRDVIQSESLFIVDMIFRAVQWLVALWYLWLAI